jgi:hypothetical protein
MAFSLMLAMSSIDLRLFSIHVLVAEFAKNFVISSTRCKTETLGEFRYGKVLALVRIKVHLLRQPHISKETSLLLGRGGAPADKQQCQLTSRS